jgi:hypothetical protein
VSGKCFKTVKREGIVLEVGHLLTIDIALEVVAAAEVVEVSGVAPAIDATNANNWEFKVRGACYEAACI